jgi:hypothetical protein
MKKGKIIFLKKDATWKLWMEEIDGFFVDFLYIFMGFFSLFL